MRHPYAAFTVLFFLASASASAAQADRSGSTYKLEWDGEMLSCPMASYEVNGKVFDMQTYNPDALGTGDVEPENFRDSYQNLRVRLNSSLESPLLIEAEKSLLEPELNTFRLNFEALAALRKGSLDTTCLEGAERLKVVDEALPLTNAGRLEAGKLWKRLEVYRKRLDSRPDCPNFDGCDPDDAGYFVWTAEATEISLVQSYLEQYACDLTRFRTRLGGLHDRLAAKNAHDSGLGSKCENKKSEALPGPVTPVWSDFSGT